jgi:hypothetical protein
MRRVKEILTRDNPAVFAPEVDARVRAAFVGLVAGDSLPPKGWSKSTAEPAPVGRSREERRRARAASG